MSEQPGFIPFNKPFTVGRGLECIAIAVASGHISGNGFFTKKCDGIFQKRYHMKKAVLTTSCTDALEMAALLLDIQSGDEIIVPSFSFVSTANPFVLRGAKIIFADSSADHPNVDAGKIESLITPRTKAIVCVHYAGMSCDMERLVDVAARANISLIEDAAHAIESRWNGGKQLGTIGQLGTFSFHETKNIIAGEGGLLSVNDESFIDRAEIISEKGTNRSSFFRNEVKKYEWIDIGSSFLASELTAAFLFAQLEHIDKIQKKRIDLWKQYHEELETVEQNGFISRPRIPAYAMTNGHIYYLICNSVSERANLIAQLAQCGIQAVFHYQSLHRSPFYRSQHDGRDLPNADRFSECLLRLPMFYELQTSQVSRISSVIRKHFGCTD